MRAEQFLETALDIRKSTIGPVISLSFSLVVIRKATCQELKSSCLFLGSFCSKQGERTRNRPESVGTPSTQAEIAFQCGILDVQLVGH